MPTTSVKQLKQIAAIILENPSGDILLYLRDNKKEIPYPHHWDLFGGHVEMGETIEQALERELMEELGIELTSYTFFGKFDCWGRKGQQNCKHVFHGIIDVPASQLTLYEGERLQFFKREEIPSLRLANVLKSIILDYLSETYHWRP